MSPTYPLVLLRHGQSTWNLENRFTGWTDVGLTPRGVEEAQTAGRALLEEGLDFDLTFTSVLVRSILTLHFCLAEMDRLWLPVRRSWRLNERHYGALQGLHKAETATEHGEDQVHIWRRSYDVPPPPLDADDERHPRHDLRYGNVDPALLPATESLAEVVGRMLPYWHEELVPEILAGQRLLISAHGNSLRALVKHLDGISDEEIPGLNIPTGIPLLYILDQDLRPVDRRYLADAATVAAAESAVEAQGKAK